MTWLKLGERGRPGILVGIVPFYVLTQTRYEDTSKQDGGPIVVIQHHVHDANKLGAGTNKFKKNL